MPEYMLDTDTVYHPFFDRDQDSIEADPALKQAVTRDHFAEIDACDVLYALAPGGYVGTSVVIEMAYAFARGTRVVTSEPAGEYAARALVSEVAAPPDFLGALLLHVANHATHHRSEIATMVTMVSGSPPDTGLVTQQLLTAGQGDMSRRWA